jgi:hypothetical protein
MEHLTLEVCFAKRTIKNLTTWVWETLRKLLWWSMSATSLRNWQDAYTVPPQPIRRQINACCKYAKKKIQSESWKPSQTSKSGYWVLAAGSALGYPRLQNWIAKLLLSFSSWFGMKLSMTTELRTVKLLFIYLQGLKTWLALSQHTSHKGEIPAIQWAAPKTWSDDTKC